MVLAICIFLGILLLVLLGSAVCFFLTFYSAKRKILGDEEYEIPPGEIYEPFRDEIMGWMRDSRTLPHRCFEIKSHDGLTLRGQYYECEPGAPIELLFHGYRGNAERDMSGGIARCFAMNRNALIIDQRASGKSEGSIITFGLKEHLDCLAWVDFAVKHFGSDVKLILTGISMGASTVLMAAGKDLPPNVICVLGDCGFSSPKKILIKVLRQIKLPPFIFYPIIKLGALIFGGINLESYSPEEAMKHASVPVILIHGDTDDFVPCEMSRELYDACASQHKRLEFISGAGHGLAFPQDKEKYLSALRQFQEECGF